MYQLQVENMSCGHCVAAVTKAVKSVDGNAFREALKPAYAGYAKECGADNIKKIQDVK